jgi:hypothetical protein
MRRILIDNARRKNALRHGGHAERVEFDLDSLELAAGMDDGQLLALHDALDALAAHDSVKAELVKQLYSAEEAHERRAKFKRMLKTSPHFGRKAKRDEQLLAA